MHKNCLDYDEYVIYKKSLDWNKLNIKKFHDRRFPKTFDFMKYFKF